MNKRKVIDRTEAFLKENGFTQADYIVSLQGPTVILSMSGAQKMNEEIREEVMKIGMQVL
jgi:sugar/nucleoside kinase (ribokinase family)